MPGTACTYFFRKTKLFLLALFLLLSSSCIQDFTGTLPSEYEWRPYLAFPIGWTEFGLNLGQGFDTLLLQLDTTGYPLWSNLVKIPFSGSILFDFEEVLGEREEVNSVQLRINAYNGFPIDIRVQAYLLDRMGTVLDSLFTPIMTMDRGTLSAELPDQISCPDASPDN